MIEYHTVLNTNNKSLASILLLNLLTPVNLTCQRSKLDEMCEFLVDVSVGIFPYWS